MSSVRVFPFLKNGNLAIAGVAPASQLQRPAPPMVTTGVAAVDELTGGLPRGALSEICGPASSGRTSLLIAALAARTAAGEACALVDVTDSFDPVSAQNAGVDLKKVLWVRCGSTDNRRGRGGEVVSRESRVVSRTAAPGIRPLKAGKKSDEKSNVEAAMEAGVLKFDPDHEYNAQHLPYEEVASRESRVASEEEDVVSRRSSVVRKEARGFQIPGASCPLPNRKLETGNRKLGAIEQALKATDFLLQAGGFGLVAVDLGDVSVRDARRIPLTSWFRFRRAVESTATVFVVLERQPFAKQCASLVLECSSWSTAIGNQRSAVSESKNPSHARLLQRMEFEVEMVRAPGAKRLATAAKFRTLPEWAIRK